MADLFDLLNNDNDWDNDWNEDPCDGPSWNTPDWCDALDPCDGPSWNTPDWCDALDPCDGPSWNTPDWCDTQDQIESGLALVGLITQPIDKAWPWIVGAVGLIILMVIGMS